MSNIKKFSSRKEVTEFLTTKEIDTSNWSEEKWLSLNKGQAEIHMMALAEAMWDAMNESTPKELKAGEWHIPFCPKFLIYKEGEQKVSYVPNPAFPEEIMDCVKVSTAICARTSYTIVGEEGKERLSSEDIALHDRMANAVPFHASPFEHCARAMSDKEYQRYVKGYASYGHDGLGFDHNQLGWCRNFKGFIQYREILETFKLEK
ncbi:MAG: hypothetical protein EKK63_02520 [Acinetobacter sp.]|uniref:hypothetical protein n=1 Tax=Acinetobacter sp. TaxID=472 RepID=UPI000FA3CF77|nr:hypothetical protein [Acinetobacter sp.]RUP42191.1 MAG: hypothetical protein EKK63_02520 [Acinetobacter sp.]